MQRLHKDLNDSEVLIVFKLTEFSRSCSKRNVKGALSGLTQFLAAESPLKR